MIHLPVLIVLIPIDYLHPIKDGCRAIEALSSSETKFIQAIKCSQVLELDDVHNWWGWLMSTYIQGKERMAAGRNCSTTHSDSSFYDQTLCTTDSAKHCHIGLLDGVWHLLLSHPSGDNDTCSPLQGNIQRDRWQSPVSQHCYMLTQTETKGSGLNRDSVINNNPLP